MSASRDVHVVTSLGAWMSRHPNCAGASAGVVLALLYTAAFALDTVNTADPRYLGYELTWIPYVALLSTMTAAVVGSVCALAGLADRALVRRLCRALTLTRESIAVAIGASIAAATPIVTTLGAGSLVFNHITVAFPVFIVAATAAAGLGFTANYLAGRSNPATESLM